MLRANQGNRLGQTVSGGIKQASTDVKTGIQQAQEKFQETAQEKRLDTEQASQQRQNILGRFGAQTQPSTRVTQQPMSDLRGRIDAEGRVNSTEPSNKEAIISTAAEQSQYTRPTPTVGTAQAGTIDRSTEGAPTPQSGAAPTQPTQAPAQPAAPQSFQGVTDKEVQDFQRFRTGTYTGPKELENSGALTGQAAQAEQLGSLTRSSGGQQELLRRFVGGEGYTQGQRRLDQTILSQDRNANLGAAARQTRGAVSDVERANEQARNLAQEYAGRARDFGAETTQQIQQTRDPISGQIDQRIQQAQAAEAQRATEFGKVQDIITGKGDFSRLPPEQRAILGLNAAASSGLLSQNDIQALVGQGGLLQRGLNVGADLPALINERLRLKQAENLTRAGVASDEERAKLSALNRLAGGLESDFEFAGQDARFQAGRGAFDSESLNREIMRAEDEKARNDAAFRARLNQEREQSQRFFNRAVGEIGGVPGDAMRGVTGVLDGNLSDGVGGVLDTYQGLYQGMANVPLALAEGLLKLNIGGQSIANTAVGEQLLRGVQGIGNFGNKQADYAFDLANQFTKKPVDAAGRVIGDTFNTAGKAIANVGRALRRIRISDEDLKEDVSYDPKDVEKFMNRIKASSYDYKKEVQDSPLASKNREIGVMAQDLEKSKLGKEAVKETKIGKVVDYDNLGPKMLASIANLNERLKKMENN